MTAAVITGISDVIAAAGQLVNRKLYITTDNPMVESKYCYKWKIRIPASICLPSPK